LFAVVETNRLRFQRLGQHLKKLAFIITKTISTLALPISILIGTRLSNQKSNPASRILSSLWFKLDVGTLVLSVPKSPQVLLFTGRKLGKTSYQYYKSKV
jgi:hypothetical protein